jgi:hypothetical protein
MAYKKTSPTLVAEGGTGIQGSTPYGVIIAGNTSTSSFQNVGSGSTGNILVSNGSSLPPFWQNSGGSGDEILLNTTTTTISNVANVVWGNTIVNNTYQWYKIVLNNFYYSGNTPQIIALLPRDTLGRAMLSKTSINYWAYNSGTSSNINNSVGMAPVGYMALVQNGDRGSAVIYLKIGWPSLGQDSVINFVGQFSTQNAAQGGTMGRSFSYWTLISTATPVNELIVEMISAGSVPITASIYGIQQ